MNPKLPVRLAALAFLSFHALTNLAIAGSLAEFAGQTFKSLVIT